ncbi:MAG: ribonuclease, partial [Chthoniobacter sp.]|nr:ribonuclease [Chthoniobacter sp.]
AGDLTLRPEVQKLLAAMRGRPEEHAIKIAFLKSLKRAAYDTNPLGHYGLAKVNYTHFTSPIRRYADLIVHRILGQISAREQTKQFRPSVVDLGNAAKHISTTERTAADAEKESVKMKKIEYLQNQLRSRKPDAFKAIIVDVRNFGMLVELPDILLTGLVHVSALQGDFFVFDQTRLRFVGRSTRKTYALGDVISVIVSRVDVFKQQIDFTPV